MTAPAPDTRSTPPASTRVCEAAHVGLNVCEAPATVAVALAHLATRAPDCSPSTALLCTAHLQVAERLARKWYGRGQGRVCSQCSNPIRRTGELIRWVEQL